MTERFVAALVGAPFGLTGRVKIESPSGETSHLLGLKKVVLRRGRYTPPGGQKRVSQTKVCAVPLRNGDKNGIEIEPGSLAEQAYLIEEIFSAPLSVKFAGIDSPEAARALKGAELLVPREQAAPLNEGEYYIEDLRGLEVVTEGKIVGIINDVIEGGNGFLVEVLLPPGQKRLVPFRDEFFGAVDPAAGRAELLEPWILE